jgi:hypothetical protein
MQRRGSAGEAAFAGHGMKGAELGVIHRLDLCDQGNPSIRQMVEWICNCGAARGRAGLRALCSPGSCARRRGHADQLLEGAAEGGLGVIADLLGDSNAPSLRLWVHGDNRECLHRARIDLEAIAERYGAELSVAGFVNKSVCWVCGAR